MKVFNKDKAERKLKLKQNKNKYIKYTTIGLSCLILVIGIIMFTFAYLETKIEFTIINGTIGAVKKEVVLNTNGGTLENNTIKLPLGEVITNLPTPTKEGFELEGWYLDNGLTQKVTNETVMTKEIKNLYAKWKEKGIMYRVEHYLMRDDGTYSDYPYYFDELYAPKGTTVRPAVRTFDGLVSPSPQEITITEGELQVVKYYYSKEIYTITFNPNGGSVSPTSKQYYSGFKIDVKPTKSGSAFAGWYTDTNYNDLVNTARATQTVYAQWSYFSTRLDGSNVCLKNLKTNKEVCISNSFNEQYYKNFSTIKENLQSKMESAFGTSAASCQYVNNYYAFCRFSESGTTGACYVTNSNSNCTIDLHMQYGCVNPTTNSSNSYCN